MIKPTLAAHTVRSFACIGNSPGSTRSGLRPAPAPSCWPAGSAATFRDGKYRDGGIIPRERVPSALRSLRQLRVPGRTGNGPSFRHRATEHERDHWEDLPLGDDAAEGSHVLRSVTVSLPTEHERSHRHADCVPSIPQPTFPPAIRRHPSARAPRASSLRAGTPPRRQAFRFSGKTQPRSYLLRLYRNLFPIQARQTASRSLLLASSRQAESTWTSTVSETPRLSLRAEAGQRATARNPDPVAMDKRAPISVSGMADHRVGLRAAAHNPPSQAPAQTDGSTTRRACRSSRSGHREATCPTHSTSHQSGSVPISAPEARRFDGFGARIDSPYPIRGTASGRSSAPATGAHAGR